VLASGLAFVAADRRQAAVENGHAPSVAVCVAVGAAVTVIVYALGWRSMRARLTSRRTSRSKHASKVVPMVAVLITSAAVSVAPPYVAALLCSIYAGVGTGAFLVLLRVVGAQGRTRAPAGD
jgi:hypothetical protein